METALLDLLGRLGDKRVLVVADLYLDRYIFGSPSRISREAPIMVLDEERQENRLGGGAAPALQLAALGYEVAVTGVVGDDQAGRAVVELLAGAGIDPGAVLIDSTRPTTTKTRVVAEGFFLFPQQVVRIDRQERAPVGADVTQALSAAVAAAQTDAILVSDYRSGVVTAELVAAIREAQALGGLLTTVDSQGDLEKFGGFDLVKCNQSEAEAVLGHPVGDRTGRERALSKLRSQIGARCLVVTRGGEGASLASIDGYDETPASNRSEIFDVTGAGDTVVAVMTAARLAGAPPLQAATLAQAAAGVVVRKWGNQQATRDEIAAELRQ
jgi:D-glycero-beta-D-manno-heptose-7-phosphate kinase